MKIFLLYIFFLFSISTYAQEIIQIDASQTKGNFVGYTGVLHGITNLRSNPVGLDRFMELKPKFWRNANWNNAQVLADSLGLKSTLVISDFYAQYKGGYPNAKPWLNWTEYESVLAALVTSARSNGIAPNYWDLWNEPDNPYYWSGSFEQYVECIIRTRNVLNSIEPTLKLVGPSISFYEPNFITALLDTLSNNSVFFDAVSWHEFGLPDSMAVHVDDFQTKSASHLNWSSPEIHINEFSPAQSQQIPAFQLAWLYYFEKKEVAWANLACWDNCSDGITSWSACNQGLNGLLWHDEQSPLPIYWVYKAYAEMALGEKMFCTTTHNKTLALSSRIDSLQTISTLVGRYYSDNIGNYLPSDLGMDSATVTINLTNYPYLINGLVQYELYQIPKGNYYFQNSPLSSPVSVSSGNLAVAGNNLTFSITNFKDGDVYLLTLSSPTASTINHTTIEDFSIVVSPNPVENDIVSVRACERLQGSHCQLYSASGLLLYSVILNKQITELDLSHFAPGMYYLKVNNEVQTILKK